MHIDFAINFDAAAADVDAKLLTERVMLAMSCLSQGEKEGVSLHPGMTIAWTLTRDEDAFV